MFEGKKWEHVPTEDKTKMPNTEDIKKEPTQPTEIIPEPKWRKEFGHYFPVENWEVNQERQRKAARLGETPISQKSPDEQVKNEQRKEEIGELKKMTRDVLDAYMKSSVGEKIATPALLVGLLIYGILYVPFKLIMYAVKKMDSKAANDFNKTYKNVYEWITGKDKKGKSGSKKKEITKLSEEEVETRTIKILHQRLNEDRATAMERNEFTIDDQKEYETNLRALRSRERINETITQEDEQKYEEYITRSRNELVEKNIWTEEQKNQYIKDLRETEKREKEEEAIKKTGRKKRKEREKKDKERVENFFNESKIKDRQENPQDYNQPQDRPEENKSTEEPKEKEETPQA